MLFCPNLSNKQIKQQWDQLVGVVGEEAAYYLYDKNGGNFLDKAPNGAKSKLFDDLLQIYHGDEKEAIKAKAKTYSPQFSQWFDGSKVVDENGEPKIVWHGTENEFSVFDDTRVKDADKHHVHDRHAFFFTDTKEKAFKYKRSKTMPVYLSLQHPGYSSVNDGKFNTILEYTNCENELLRDNQYDSAIFERYDKEGDRHGMVPTTQFVAKRPGQIKSVRNEGPFSTNNDDIYYHLEPDWKTVYATIEQYVDDGKLEARDKVGRYFFPRWRNDIHLLKAELERIFNSCRVAMLYFPGKSSKYGRKHFKLRGLGAFKGDKKIQDAIEKDTEWCDDVFAVAEEMSKVFPELQFRMATNEDLIGVHYGATSFVRNGVVYFIPGKKITKEAVLEECLHPLIAAIEQENPQLFNSFVKQAAGNFRLLASEIGQLYSTDYGFTGQDQRIELVTQALSRCLLREQKSPKHSIKEFLDMFTEWVNGFLKRIGIRYNSNGKAVITAKDLPSTLRMTELAKLINTRDVEFKTRVEERIRYHINAKYDGNENTSQLQKLFNRQYARMKRQVKRPGEYGAQDQLFKAMSEITAQINQNSVARAAKYCIDVLGPANMIDNATHTVDYSNRTIGEPKNLLDVLHNAELNNYDNVTPQDLYNMYNDHISFIEKLCDTFPSPGYEYTQEIATDMALIQKSLAQVMTEWRRAISVVGDRIVDELVDKYVVESEEKKNILKDNMKDELHYNLITNDIGAGSFAAALGKLSNYAFSNSDLVKAAFHNIGNAEQQAREQTIDERKPILDLYKKCRTLWPGNWQRRMMEYDRNGRATGYFVRDLNYGQHRQDLEEFTKKLDEEFINTYGHTYKKDDNGEWINSVTGTYAEDEAWDTSQPVPVAPVWVEYQRRLNQWHAAHTVRRYTAKYYEERLSVPFVPGKTTGHGLSPKTLSRYNRIQSQINYFLERCTHDDGIAYTEELDDEQLAVLDQWQAEMKDLTNPFYRDGTPKPIEDYECALEIQAWQKWLNQQLESEVDSEAFVNRVRYLSAEVRQADNRVTMAENVLYCWQGGYSYENMAALVHPDSSFGISDKEMRSIYSDYGKIVKFQEKLKKEQERAHRVFDAFAKYNSQLQINPQYIKQTIGQFDTDYLDITDPYYKEVLLKQAALRKLVPLRDDSIEPDLRVFENNPQFFYNLQQAEQAVSDKGGSDVLHPDIHNPATGDVKRYKDVHDANFKYEDALYVDKNGVYKDVNGNDTSDRKKAITWLAYIRKKYVDEIINSASRNGGIGQLYGLKDSAGNIITIDLSSAKGSRINEESIAGAFVDENLLRVNYATQGGNVISRPLSVFTYRSPLEKVTSNGQRIAKPGYFIVTDTDGVPILDSNGQVREEKIILHQGTNRYVTRKDKSKTTDKLIDDRFDKTRGESSQPSRALYDNTEAYGKVRQNRKLSALYDALTDKMKQVISDIRPDIGTYDYRLPQLEGQLGQILSRIRFGERGLSLKKAWDYIKESTFGIQSRDFTMRTGSEIGSNPDDTPNSSIPDRFIRKLDDPSLISSNLVGGVLLMIGMKNNYRNKEKVLHELFILLENLNPKHRDDEFSLRGKNTFKTMLSLITTHLFDMRDQGKFDPTTEEQQKKRVATQKAMQHTKRIAQMGMLFANLMSPLIGFGDSLATQVKDALIAKYYSVRDWAFGLRHTCYYLAHMITNIGNPIPNNKLSALMQMNGISTSLSASSSELYKSRAGKLFRGGVKMAAGAAVGHVVGSLVGRVNITDFTWMGSQLGLMCAGAGVGLFSAFDYFTNAVLLTANYHHVRFFKGNGSIPAGFYTKRELQTKFQEAGLSWKKGGMSRIWSHGRTLWDAYKFSNGNIQVRDEYTEYVTDRVTTQVSTNTQHRAALTNGMAPDNDRPDYMNTLWGKFFLSLRNYIPQVLQHNLVSGHSFIKKQANKVQDKKRGFGEKWEITGNEVQNHNAQGGFNWETGEMQDEIVRGLARSIKTMCLKLKSLFIRGANSGYKFSSVEKYAWKEILASISVMLGLMLGTVQVKNWAVNTAKVTIGSQWNPEDWYNNGIYSLVILNWCNRTVESLMTRIDPTQMYELVSTATTLATGATNYLRPVSIVTDALGIGNHEPTEINKSGAYKGEARWVQHLYTGTIIPGQLHKTNSFYGALNNYQYYQNKFGFGWKLLGEDMRLSQKDFEDGDSGQYGPGNSVGQRGIGQRGVGQRGVGQRGVGQRGIGQRGVGR